MHVSTLDCNCSDQTKSEPPKTIRLVGNKLSPRFYIDVLIYDKVFTALLNFNLTNTSINWKVVNWVHSQNNEIIDRSITEIEIPIRIDVTTTQVECEIDKDSEEDIILGVHFLCFHGFKLIFNETCIDSESSPIAKSKNEITYLYNSPEHGQDLREYLRHQKFFMKKDKTKVKRD